jgi:hypothetical protein
MEKWPREIDTDICKGEREEEEPKQEEIVCAFTSSLYLLPSKSE